MQRVVAGGTGLIGRHLIKHWLSQGHDVAVIGRDKNYIRAIFENSVTALDWTEVTVENLQSAEVVVNLAGASVGLKRWSKERRQEILNSRINTTKQLADILAIFNSGAPHLLNASAIGIYGAQKPLINQLPQAINEDNILTSSADFLPTIGRRWEAAAQSAMDAGVPVTFLRFGVVLAKNGGALPRMVKPFTFGLGGRIGSGHQPFSWVAIDDVVTAIDFLIEHKNITGPVNIVAPQCVSQKELAKAIGKILKKPSAFPMPAQWVKLLFGEMGRELLLEGQHIYPLRLHENGFHFRYPDLSSALKHILL